MGLLKKMHGVIGLFIMLVSVLAISPKTIKDAYDTILGRICLLAVVVFVSSENITLGLLVVLILIISLNMYLIEGLENNQEPDSKCQNLVSKLKTIVNEEGVCKETIEDSVKPKSSKSLPPPPPSSTTSEPAASDSTTDGFCAMGSPF